MNAPNRFTPRPQTLARKPFTWSYSKLKNYEACAQKHLKVDLDKSFEELPSQQLKDGNDFHDAMKMAVGQCSALPASLVKFQKWVTKLTHVSNPYQIIQVEQKLAITKDLKPCGFFDKDVWFRGVVDYLKLVPVGENQLALMVDYKTGKLLDDPVQLALFAQLIFSHHPSTLRIRTEYLWTQEGDGGDTTREDFEPKDMVQLWTLLLPRVAALEGSYNTGVYPVKPSGLCKKHCPVASCAHYQKGRL
jgi:hypothetical protein